MGFIGFRVQGSGFTLNLREAGAFGVRNNGGRTWMVRAGATLMFRVQGLRISVKVFCYSTSVLFMLAPMTALHMILPNNVYRCVYI